MYLLGLCGRSGSGKSTVCRFLREKGVYCIDADRVCHDVYDTDADCVRELCQSFGVGILTEGKVNRKSLANAAFSTEGGVTLLNSIAHKYITAAILKEAEGAFKNGKRFVLLDAPTLFESGLNRRCHGIISVIADDKMLIERLKQRDGLDADMLKKRLKSQKSNCFLAKNSTSIIVNKGNKKKLRANTYKAMLVLQLKLGILKASKETKRYGQVKR